MFGLRIFTNTISMQPNNISLRLFSGNADVLRLYLRGYIHPKLLKSLKNVEVSISKAFSWLLLIKMYLMIRNNTFRVSSERQLDEEKRQLYQKYIFILLYFVM